MSDDKLDTAIKTIEDFYFGENSNSNLGRYIYKYITYFPTFRLRRETVYRLCQKIQKQIPKFENFRLN